MHKNLKYGIPHKIPFMMVPKTSVFERRQFPSDVSLKLK